MLFFTCSDKYYTYNEEWQLFESTDKGMNWTPSNKVFTFVKSTDCPDMYPKLTGFTLCYALESDPMYAYGLGYDFKINKVFSFKGTNYRIVKVFNDETVLHYFDPADGMWLNVNHTCFTLLDPEFCEDEFQDVEAPEVVIDGSVVKPFQVFRCMGTSYIFDNNHRAYYGDIGNYWYESKYSLDSILEDSHRLSYSGGGVQEVLTNIKLLKFRVNNMEGAFISPYQVFETINGVAYVYDENRTLYTYYEHLSKWVKVGDTDPVGYTFKPTETYVDPKDLPEYTPPKIEPEKDPRDVALDALTAKYQDLLSSVNSALNELENIRDQISKVRINLHDAMSGK